MALFLCYLKLCSSFSSHQSILTRFTVWKSPIRVNISTFRFRVTLKFDGWPWKTTGHLFYATSNFDPVKSGQNWQLLILCDLEIWWMTLKNNRNLFYATPSFVHHLTTIGSFKLDLQSGNAQFWVKIGDFWSRVTLKFDRWPLKTIAHLFYATSSFVNHFITICEFKLELQSGNG